jgi:hypothetical protein
MAAGDSWPILFEHVQQDRRYKCDPEQSSSRLDAARTMYRAPPKVAIEMDCRRLRSLQSPSGDRSRVRQ